MRLEQNIVQYILEHFENQIYIDNAGDTPTDHKNNSFYDKTFTLQLGDYSYEQIAYHIAVMDKEELFLTGYVDESKSGEFIRRVDKAAIMFRSGVIKHNIHGLTQSGQTLLAGLRDKRIKIRLLDYSRKVGSFIIPHAINFASSQLFKMISN